MHEKKHEQGVAREAVKIISREADAAVLRISSAMIHVSSDVWVVTLSPQNNWSCKEQSWLYRLSNDSPLLGKDMFVFKL